MKPGERLLIRLGGYAPRTVEGNPHEEREPLTKLGWAVLLAVLVAAANWSIAGWVYSEGVATPIRFVILLFAGALGGSIVLVFDRGFLYFSDTSIAKGRINLIIYAAFRVIIILLVGSITAQAVMPIIMGKELSAHALAMIEKSEAERMSKLGSQHNLDAKKSAVEAATSEVKRLEKAASTTPPDIQQKLAAARSCWAEYSSRKIGLVGNGYSDAEARERLGWKAAKCDRESKTANADRDGYFKRTRKQLNTAVDIKTQTFTEFSDANANIKGKIERAREIEADAITPRSTTVLWSLLKSDPGALIKWAIISMTLLVLELFPLIQKLQAGQSSIGRRIATDRAIRRLHLAEQLARSEHDAVVADAVNEASTRAVADAMINPAVRATFAQVFAANMAAYAPTQAVQAMMHEFSARQYDVDQFMHRSPRYASIIAQAWSKAIRETTEILARGIRGGPIQGAGQPT